MAAWRAGVISVGKAISLAGSHEALEMEPVELGEQVPPGLAGCVLGDPDEQQGE